MGTQQVVTFQQALFNFDSYQIEGVSKTKKRIRFKTPTYTKSYSFYHINPITNELQYDGDEKHIFRIRNLHNIYSKIYGYCGINPLACDEKILTDGLTVWREDLQAEITGSEMLSIKERLKLHIKLLKLLRKNVRPALAVRVAKYYAKSRINKEVQ